MQRVNIPSAVTAGLGATIALTLMMTAAPLMGMPKMDIAGMLAGFMHAPLILGWLAHFMIGTALAGGYVLFFAARGHQPGWIKGALYSLIPWLMAQLIVMPMMGAPLFSGSLVLAMGSLVGHLVYGSVLGALYRPFPAQKACAVAAH